MTVKLALKEKMHVPGRYNKMNTEEEIHGWKMYRRYARESMTSLSTDFVPQLVFSPPFGVGSLTGKHCHWAAPPGGTVLSEKSSNITSFDVFHFKVYPFWDSTYLKLYSNDKNI